MTLAIIFLVGISCALAPPPMAGTSAAQSAPQTTPAEKPATTEQTQDQAAPAQSPSPGSKSGSASTPAQTSSGQNQPAPPKHPHHKKKRNTVNCVTAPSAAGSKAAPSESSGTPGNSVSGAASAPGAQASASPSPASPAPASPAPANPGPTICPPSKVIVRQGGTTEPSIQLAGGAVGHQAAQQRDTDNQILKSTEENLKTITGRQLSPNQEDMVNQIHQFMEQAKTAIAAGELDRARTLASKAQQLSQELVQPQK
jgi:hypothetical protein